MLSNVDIFEYYENHRDEYPVIFFYDEGEDWLTMMDHEDGFIMAVLEDEVYDVFPSKIVPYVFQNDFIDDAKHYQLVIDENNPKEILDAFVDLTYLSLYKIRQEIDDMMRIIESRDED